MRIDAVARRTQEKIPAVPSIEKLIETGACFRPAENILDRASTEAKKRLQRLQPISNLFGS